MDAHSRKSECAIVLVAFSPHKIVKPWSYLVWLFPNFPTAKMPLANNEKLRYRVRPQWLFDFCLQHNSKNAIQRSLQFLRAMNFYKKVSQQGHTLFRRFPHRSVWTSKRTKLNSLDQKQKLRQIHADFPHTLISLIPLEESRKIGEDLL